MKWWRQIKDSLGWSVGVDLGTANTLVYVKDRGVVIDEPTVVARLKKRNWVGLGAPRSSSRRPIVFGERAKEMLNREPKQIEVVRPIRNGLVADVEATESLVAYFLGLTYEIPRKYWQVLRPRVIVGTVGEMTDVQRRAIKSVFHPSGIREVVLVEQAVLTAVGAGLPVERSSGLLVVDVGGGKTEASVVSAGGVVVGRGMKTSGSDFDMDLLNYLRMKYGLLVGQNTAERAKIELSGKEESAVVRGRDLETGLPRSLKIGRGEMAEAVSLNLMKIAGLVNEVLDETPPELMDDILKKGMFLAGNGSRVWGLDKLLTKETGVGVIRADDGGWGVIRGCGELIQDPEKLRTIRLVTIDH